jgi:hypothetical protein
LEFRKDRTYYVFIRREGGNCHKEREDQSLLRTRDNNFWEPFPKEGLR